MQASISQNENPIGVIAVVSSKSSKICFQLQRTGVSFISFDDYDSLNSYCKEHRPSLLLITQDNDTAFVADRVLRNSMFYDLLGIPILAIGQIETENCILNLVASGVADVVSSEAVDLELISRIKALAHRSQLKRVEREFHPYLFNVENQQLLKNGALIDTTSIEFKLALFLFSNPNVIHSREDLLDQVWEISVPIDSRRVDTHISRLRTKLALDGKDNQWYLMSVYVRGYMLSERHLTKA